MEPITPTRYQQQSTQVRAFVRALIAECERRAEYGTDAAGVMRDAIVAAALMGYAAGRRDAQ